MDANLEVVNQKTPNANDVEAARSALAALESFLSEINDEYIDYEAWTVFHVWLNGRPESDVPYFSAFRSWQLFHWTPDPATVALPISDQCRTIADAYLKTKSTSVSSEQARILKLGLEHSPDFFEVIGFEGELVIATALTTQKTVRIFHPGLPSQLRLGCFVMAHAIPSQNEIYILLGISQPISRKAQPMLSDYHKLVSRLEHANFGLLQSDFLNLFYNLSYGSLAK